MITNSIIYSINVDATVSEFETALQDFISNKNLDVEFNTEIKKSKKGYTIYDLTMHNNEDSYQEVEFLFPVSNDTIHFVNTSFKEMNKSFYSFNVDEATSQNLYIDDYNITNDPFNVFCSCIEQIARNKGGTIIYKSFLEAPTAIVDGKSKIVQPCVVDVYGKVYGQSVKDEEVKVQVEDIQGMNLKDWLKEHKEDSNIVAILSSNKDNTDKYYDIAKYLIVLKNKDELSTDLFKSLFEQAGMIDGFVKDNTLSNIYKLMF